MHLIWLSCCCSCDVLFIVRCWMRFCRLWMHFDNFNWCCCQKKKNSAPTKTTRKYVTTRLKFKWKIKRGRKKLLKASMRGKIAKTADADAARFFCCCCEMCLNGRNNHYIFMFVIINIKLSMCACFFCLSLVCLVHFLKKHLFDWPETWSDA